VREELGCERGEEEVPCCQEDCWTNLVHVQNVREGCDVAYGILVRLVGLS
jgi:hypothetical protein